jgi:hypothetical protein
VPTHLFTGVGNHTELFVDDYFVDARPNLRRSMHSPLNEKVAIAADAPWERAGPYAIGIIGTSVVLEDTGVIRIW